MDNRIFTIDGLRAARLRREDLPLLARSIVGVSRGYGVLTAGRVRGVGYARLKGKNFDIIVLKEDWLKVEPLLRDGTLSTVETPKFDPAVFLDPNKMRSLAAIDGPDRIYYLHVLGQLWVLFPETWPTSST